MSRIMNPLVPNAYELIVFIVIPILITIGLVVFLSVVLRRKYSKSYNNRQIDGTETEI